MAIRWTLARREFAGILRERTILLAIVIQVFVAGFSSVLVVGLSALADPGSLPPDTGIVVATAEPSAIEDRLRERGVGIERFTDRSEALSAFQAGRTDAALLVDDANGTREVVLVTLALPDGDIRATLILVQIKEVLEDYERELRDERRTRLVVEPLHLETSARGGEYAFVMGLLIPLLVFLPVIVAGGLVADSITEELQKGTMPLLLATPATLRAILDAKVLANAATAPVLTAAWLLLLAVNGFAAPPAGAAAIIVLAAAIAVTAGVLAAAIALLTKDRDAAQVIYAIAFFLVGGATLLLPVSPVNAMALVAAGSAHGGVWAVVAGSVVVAVASWAGLRWRTA